MRVSGDDQFVQDGTVIRGSLLQSSGSLQAMGTFSSLTFSAYYPWAFDNVDVFEIQLGAVAVPEPSAAALFGAATAAFGLMFCLRKGLGWGSKKDCELWRIVE